MILWGWGLLVYQTTMKSDSNSIKDSTEWCIFNNVLYQEGIYTMHHGAFQENVTRNDAVGLESEILET